MEKVLESLQQSNEYAKNLLEEFEAKVREQRLKIDQEQDILQELLRKRSILKNVVYTNNELLGFNPDND